MTTANRVYCDEAGIHAGSPCYGIGAFVVAEDSCPRIEQALLDIRNRYGLTEELKWSRIGDYRATRRAAFESIRMLLSSGASYHAIIVEKATYRRWKESEEKAFWVSYYQLLRHIARRHQGHCRVLADFRSDSYDKHDEVLERITNHYLRKLGPRTPHEVAVEFVDSRQHLLVQCADVLTGAIVADTARWLAPQTVRPNDGKLTLIRHVARLVGWNRLCYDTYPNAKLNVWHFPEEFRARPASATVRLSAA
jgi:hypothetical protein